MAGMVSLNIDASDLQQNIDRLRNAMAPQQFTNAMYGVFNRTSRHVATILKKDLPKEYEVKPSAVGAAVGKGQVTVSGMGVGCIIPVQGPRRSIGNTIRASGGAHGWASLHRKYRVKAKILRSSTSTLPPTYHDGGQPVFRNLSAPSLNGVAFARKGRSRGPIQAIVGISIAQMPTNLSEPAVQKDIKEYLEKQIEQRLSWLLRSGK